MQFKTMIIDHRGVPVHIPFTVYQASSVSLYSLLDYETACRLCEKENCTPVIIKTQEGKKKAVGVISFLDYRKTSLVPYREWSLGISVTSKNIKTPEIDYINATSLFFQSMLDDDLIGNTIYCPELVLTEPLPTEVGLEYYGIPKELGDITYTANQPVSDFSVSPRQGPWIMKASFPTKSGILSKFRLLAAMFKAYSFRLVLQSMSRKEFLVTLLGSAQILAKKAYMKIEKDPKTDMFPWNSKDSRMEVNPDSEWGKIIWDLQFQPELVCHVPDLKFEFSEPLDQ